MLPDYRVRQRDYLLEISRAMTSRLNVNDVLRLILQQSAEILNGQAALVGLVEPDGKYHVRQAYGIPDPLLHQLEPLLKKTEKLSEAVETLEENLVSIAQRLGLGLWQVVSLPLKVDGDEFLGALYVFRIYGGEFTRNDRKLLESFADQAAIAVNNARLYEQLAQEKRRLDAILEFSADGLVIMDAAHHILMFNQLMSRMIGVPAEEAIGKKFEEVLLLARRSGGTTLEEAEAQGWPMVGSATPLFVEGELSRRTGGTISVDITFAALFDREGRLVNIIADVHDLTRFRQAEEMKNTFISSVSHELKTPVALIKGYASTMRRADANWTQEVVGDSLQVIEEEADRLNELIENLLDASRAQAGRFKLTPVELDIDELVVKVARKYQAQSKSHLITADVAPNMPLVLADEARITQVLGNLISNAIKYSPEGGEIRVTGETFPHEVVISISDQGMGIAKEDQEKLFNSFYRAEVATRRGIAGTGLGLYLSRVIVESHGGRIWVESDGVRGSRFSFSLPRVN